MGKVKIFVLSLLTLLLAASCSIQPRSSGAVNTSKAVLGARPTGLFSSAQPNDYLLGYGDVIEVKFFNNEQYNEVVAVRPDGKISLQRVGDIRVVGMTTSELDKIITETYSEILIDPDVTVFVREFGGQEFYVMGEVAKPGKYPVEKGMTLLRALATAGGPKETAKLNSVILLRADEHGRAEATRVNLDLSYLRDDMRRDLSLRAYDVIYVPKTFIADVNAWVSQFYDVLLPPLDVWTRYKYWYNRD